MRDPLRISEHLHLRVGEREQARFRAAAGAIGMGQSIVIRKLMGAFCDCIKEHRDPGLQFRLASVSAGRHVKPKRARRKRVAATK